MTPNQLYASPHIQESNDFLILDRFIAEVDFNQLDQIETVEGLSIRYYARHCSDGERIWHLFSVWYNGKPFMVCQLAGRGGHDHFDDFVTDYEVYHQLVKHLVSLYPAKPEAFFDPNQDFAGLTEFYSNKLQDFYDPTLHTPKYKVGDIVKVRVLEHHLRDRYSANPVYIETRVRIDDVHPYCSLKTYGGTQIDRRIEIIGLVIVEDPGNGSLGAQFNDQDIVE